VEADFNRRGDWTTLLLALGWVPVDSQDGLGCWQRLGPGGAVILAATGPCPSCGTGDLLQILPSSDPLPPLVPGGWYRKFRVLSKLLHGGSDRAAAAHLRALGYGGVLRRKAKRPQRSRWGY